MVCTSQATSFYGVCAEILPQVNSSIFNASPNGREILLGRDTIQCLPSPFEEDVTIYLYILGQQRGSY